MKKFLKELWDRPERMVAFAAIIGTVFIVYEIRDRGRSLETQAMNTQAQIDAVKVQTKIYSAQVFSRAVELLGSKQGIIQLGAMHSLERLSEESGEYYWPIMKVLMSYCREHASPALPEDIDPMYEYANFVPAPDSRIQAIIDIFKRREDLHGIEELKGKRFDLNHMDLSKANLADIDLSKADLQNIFLIDANLTGANLSGANMKKACLLEANLSRANMRNAYLAYAHMEGIILEFADLTNAMLDSSHLSGARLSKVDLSGASMKYASLNDADLLMADLKKAVMAKANLNNANFTKANLNGADLFDAYLDGAYLDGANLEGAINLTIEQLSNVKTLYKAKLDPELMDQVKEKYPHLLEDPYKKKRAKTR
jgi:uncharacterized protein YjbI with pentapeptide repeats